MESTWPGRGLVLRSPAVELVAVTDALVEALQAVLPPDLELDPAVPLPPGDLPTARGLAFAAALRRDRDRFSPDDWKLHLAVRCPDGALVGLQTVEAERFREDRIVDSASWLIAGARGRGIGMRMREAALSFAFGSLGAVAAVSSAWHDNAASLGVSRRLGYRYDRTSRLVTPDRDDDLVHVRLDRADWLASGLGRDVEVTGARPAEFGALSAPSRTPRSVVRRRP
jgi:RimJ/RimL family protein N-acetyltransferase